jgi:hypothetical protein
VVQILVMFVGIHQNNQKQNWFFGEIATINMRFTNVLVTILDTETEKPRWPKHTGALSQFTK